MVKKLVLISIVFLLGCKNPKEELPISEEPNGKAIVEESTK